MNPNINMSFSSPIYHILIEIHKLQYRAMTVRKEPINDIKLSQTAKSMFCVNYIALGPIHHSLTCRHIAILLPK